MISVVTCALLSGCGVFDSTTGSRSCDPHESMRHPSGTADYQNFIKWDGRIYVSDPISPKPATFGRQLGMVRCRRDGSRTPVMTEPRDRDAGFLPEGTPFFAVEGLPPTSGIGAKWRGLDLLFSAEPPRS
jgi:hypothetical protein